MTVRELQQSEYVVALALAWRVFERFEAPDYCPEGIISFQNTIHDPAFLSRIRCYGAFEADQLVGMLATRSGGAHIALFFVDEAYHRKGIGRALFELALSEAPKGMMTVNSSPYAIEVYKRLGFVATMPEQLTDGIRYTPMALERA